MCARVQMPFAGPCHACRGQSVAIFIETVPGSGRARGWPRALTGHRAASLSPGREAGEANPLCTRDTPSQRQHYLWW